MRPASLPTSSPMQPDQSLAEELLERVRAAGRMFLAQNQDARTFDDSLLLSDLERSATLSHHSRVR